MKSLLESKNLHFRSLKPADLTQVDKIYRDYYQDYCMLPNLNHTIESGVVDSDDGIIGFGMVKLYPEAIIVLDSSKRLRDRIGAHNLLLDVGLLACSKYKHEELRAHVVDSNYERFLTKNFNFETVKGSLMIKDL